MYTVPPKKLKFRTVSVYATMNEQLNQLIEVNLGLFYKYIHNTNRTVLIIGVKYMHYVMHNICLT